MAEKLFRGEKDEVIIARCKEAVPDWKDARDSDFAIRRMSGLSNACYRVQVTSGDSVYLYRKFQNALIALDVEQTIFSIMGEQGLGPHCLIQTQEYRIEEFIPGRPISIWEMRNPHLAKVFCAAIANFNFNTKAREAV